jgi:hypothetical protein
LLGMCIKSQLPPQFASQLGLDAYSFRYGIVGKNYVGQNE